MLKKLSLAPALAVSFAVVGPAIGAPAGIVAVRTTASTAQLLDPLSAVWKHGIAYHVAMQPQNMAEPMNLAPAIRALTVRALANPRGWIAFLLEWRDPTKDETSNAGKWADAVAIELPLDPASPPAPMMGNQGGRVNIIQWRADWQKDVDHGPTSIKAIYPNMHLDAPPDRIYKGSDKEGFSAGRAIGNPVSQQHHFAAVEDLMAEGFGSLTFKPIQSAVGHGIWRDGVWHVVIARPLEPFTDPDAALLKEPGASNIGFAVWDGGAGEHGSRKSWAAWIPLEIR